VQDDEARHRVHRSAGEVKIVADANDVRIGKFVVEKRIGVSAVAVVSGP